MGRDVRLKNLEKEKAKEDGHGQCRK